jgi:NAD(P)-dependent dehydrogenase (short-subunit alcohol dehydrogenase family)
MDVNGKVVIVTGASEGIGLGAAQLLAARGAKVALNARSKDKLEKISAKLPNSLVVHGDMRDEDSIRAMVEKVQAHYGRIDVLINNAGQALHVPVEHVKPEEYRSVFQLNVIGVLVAMQAVIPLMRAQGGGVIINISSGTSKMFLPNRAPYASTKYALNCLSLTARAELAPDNIRVGVVYPGITTTRFIENAARVQFAGPRRTGMQPDSVEHVADKILEAIETEAAEVYADSIKPK